MKKTKIKCTSTAQNVHPRDEKRDRIFKRKRIIYGIKTSFFYMCVVRLILRLLWLDLIGKRRARQRGETDGHGHDAVRVLFRHRHGFFAHHERDLQQGDGRHAVESEGFLLFIRAGH